MKKGRWGSKFVFYLQPEYFFLWTVCFGLELCIWFVTIEIKSIVLDFSQVSWNRMLGSAKTNLSLLTLTSWVKSTSPFHLWNLHQTSASWLNLRFKILTKPSFRTSTKINFTTSTKQQRQNTEQTPASDHAWTSTSKSWQKTCAQSLNKSLVLWPNSASKSATNCCQHDPHHQHQQQ